MDRRNFIKNIGKAGLAIALSSVYSDINESANYAVAQTKKKILHDNIYLVSYDGYRFKIENENGNVIEPLVNNKFHIIKCYLTDDKVNSISIHKLDQDVSKLERLVRESVSNTILEYAHIVWKKKTNPFDLLKSIFKLGGSLETDPRFYIKVLVGNISSNLGYVQRDAINFVNKNKSQYNSNILDTSIYDVIYDLLKESEPYIDPGYNLLSSALRSNNFILDVEEKELISKMRSDEKREYIMGKIKGTSEFNIFNSDVTNRQNSWEMLIEKTKSAIY